MHIRHAVRGCTGKDDVVDVVHALRPSAILSVTIMLGLVAVGCEGHIGDPPGAFRTVEPGGPAIECEEDALYVDGAPIRRLSRTEYRNSVAALFPGPDPDLPVLPDDGDVRGFENAASALGASELLVDRYEETAFRYAEAVTADPSTLAAFLPCERFETEAEQTACGDAFIDTFGLRTHRRPLTEEEKETYVAFFAEQRAAIDFEAAVQLTAMAMLQAPQFLYRIELNNGGEADGYAELSPWELASRLSFLLWESGPDAALFELAEADALRDPATLEAQARRMLEDPRARATVVNFHRQWLDLDRILAEEHRTRVDEVYAGWDETLQRAIREESDRFVEYALFEGDGTLEALLTSQTTYVNGPLADLYGVPGPADADTWERVELPGEERVGILTQANFLASHSHRANGSPPLRGVFVLERLLCTPPPPPPPDADTSPPQPDPTEGPRTNRELFEERTSPALCQGCHTVIDGFGFPFEHFDAAGAYRAQDQGLPVDATGWATGTDFDGPVEDARDLSRRLADSDRVRECVVDNWFRYANGRAPTDAERCATRRLADTFAASGGDVRELLVAIATSPEFRVRRVIKDGGSE